MTGMAINTNKIVISPVVKFRIDSFLVGLVRNTIAVATTDFGKAVNAGRLQEPELALHLGIMNMIDRDVRGYRCQFAQLLRAERPDVGQEN